MKNTTLEIHSRLELVTLVNKIRLVLVCLSKKSATGQRLDLLIRFSNGAETRLIPTFKLLRH